MDTNRNLKELWNAQKAANPDVSVLYKKANKIKRKSKFTSIFVGTTLLITIAFVCFIWHFYQPDFLTTKIGLVLTILAMVVFLIPLTKQFSNLNKNQKESNSKEYLEQLIQIKKAQVFQQTKILSSYFILLTLGILLYLIEYVSRMTFVWGCITYFITLAWFAFNWWYLRPKITSKQNEKLNNIVADFEKIIEQTNL